MWQNEKTVYVQRSLMEMCIEDLEYESRKREARREKFFDDLFDDLFKW